MDGDPVATIITHRRALGPGSAWTGHADVLEPPAELVSGSQPVEVLLQPEDRQDADQEGEVTRAVGLVDRAEYKRRQAPPGVKITARALGRDRRMPVVDHIRPPGAGTARG